MKYFLKDLIKNSVNFNKLVAEKVLFWKRMYRTGMPKEWQPTVFLVPPDTESGVAHLKNTPSILGPLELCDSSYEKYFVHYPSNLPNFIDDDKDAFLVVSSVLNSDDMPDVNISYNPYEDLWTCKFSISDGNEFIAKNNNRRIAICVAALRFMGTEILENT